MKIIIFFVVIIIIYFLANSITVVHKETLSQIEQKQLNDKNKIRSMLMSNHIRCAGTDCKKPIEKFNQDNSQEYSIDTISNQDNTRTEVAHSVAKKKFDLPTAYEMVVLIKSEFLDTKYLFNMANQPVTTKSNSNHNNKYIKHIKNNIKDWNTTLRQNYKNNSSKNMEYVKIVEVKPIFIKETNNEFIITANVHLLYVDKAIYLQLTYYGKTEMSDDFLNGGVNTCILQMINIKPITQNEYSHIITTANKYTTPFITMDEQMKYVNRINKMHQNEEEYY